MPKFKFILIQLVLLSLIIVLYNEAIIYTILPFQWAGSPACEKPNCYRLLLVADAQILGKAYNLIDKIALWDCDNYLRKTFVQAMHYINPDIIAFLGDLMDSGHISNDDEFLYDLHRFKDIFSYSKNIDTIILPGDNDIGGEDDIILPNIVSRFNKIFDQSSSPLVKDTLEVYKVNYLTYSYQEPRDKNDDNVVRVAVSHLPLLSKISPFVKSVLNKVKPDIIFSAHDHHSLHVTNLDKELWKRKLEPLLPSNNTIKTYKLKSGVTHEICVPTCSYRMGVSNIGYGAAFIDTEEAVVKYQVLWLPKRFHQLYVYLALVTILFIYFVSKVVILIWNVFKKLFRYVLYKLFRFRYHGSDRYVP